MSERQPVRFTKANRSPITFMTVVFVLMLIYFAIQGYRSYHKTPVQAYNIGTASSDSVYGTRNGIILRHEKVVTAPEDGYVSYYAVENDLASIDTLICTIDKKGDLNERLHKLYYGQEVLSDDSKRNISQTVRDAASMYDRMNFSSVSDARTSIQAQVFRSLLKDSDENGFFGDEDNFISLSAEESGFICYYEDGLENALPENLTERDFTEGRETIVPSAGKKVEQGDFVYKEILDNKFTLTFLLTDQDSVNISQKSKLTIRFSDGRELTGNFSTSYTSDGQKLGIVSFVKYGSNYLADRMVPFQILDKTITGYKIPESSIVKKSLFVVDTAYVMKTGNSNAYGVVRRTADKDEFIPCSVYRKNGMNEEADSLILGEDTAYIYSDELKAGDVLVPNSAQDRIRENMSLGVMTAIEGVYQINNGYCVFKPIVRLSNSLETSYVVISPYVRQGLSAYDRIVLDASFVDENEIIFE